MLEIRPTTAPCRTLIVGCGNLLRGDDAVGPLLIRHLWELGLPDGVRCADGGTGGLDVCFQMRNVPEVLLIDACTTGAEPGTLYEVPGAAVEHLPPPSGMNLHAVRWDHALGIARWLLKDEYPAHVTAYLVEAAQLDLGAPLSAPVEAAMHRLIARLRARIHAPEPVPA
ncbi:MAG: hydrogenase maturation protease [Gemmatimonadales bacterium]|nr:hydrogenase maturation protease [Gemmatimonadales bacterium]